MAEKKRLSAAKGWVTRAIASVDSVLEEFTIDTDALSLALENLDKRVKTYRESQSVLEDVLEEEDEISKCIDDSAQIEDQVTSIKARARKELNKNVKSISQDANCTINGSNLAGVRLPKLELPSFSGDILSWQSFWESFRVTVDDSDLPDISKFTYLRSLLKDGASTVLDGLSVTADNYRVAKELLEDRFGQRELIIYAHVQALIELKQNDKDLSVRELRGLYEKIIGHVRSLESLHVSSKQYGIILTPMIVSCLPCKLKLEWAKEDPKNMFDLDCLMDFLKENLEGLERSEQFSQTTKFKSVSKDEPKGGPKGKGTYKGGPSSKGSEKKATASALHVTSDNKCSFCDKSHKTEDCYQLVSLNYEDRMQKIKEARLCFRCVRPGHTKYNCRSFVTCSICGSRNHTKLRCRQLVGKKQEEKSEPAACNFSVEPSKKRFLLVFKKM